MAKDKTPKDEADFGNTGKARDGEPVNDGAGTPDGGFTPEDDELARKRAGKNGGAIGDREPEGEDPPEELFPLGSLEGDPKITIKTLIKAGMVVEYTASLMSGEVPLTGGLLDPQDDGHMAMIRYEVAKIETVPIREEKNGTKRIKGYKLRQILRPVYVEPIEASKTTGAASG